MKFTTDTEALSQAVISLRSQYNTINVIRHNLDSVYQTLSSTYHYNSSAAAEARTALNKAYSDLYTFTSKVDYWRSLFMAAIGIHVNPDFNIFPFGEYMPDGEEGGWELRSSYGSDDDDDGNLLSKYKHNPNHGPRQKGKDGRYAPKDPGYYSYYNGDSKYWTFKDGKRVPNYQKKDEKNIHLKVFELSGSGEEVFGYNQSWGGKDDPYHFDAKAGAWVTQSGSFSIGDDGIRAKGKVEAAFGAKGSARYDFGQGTSVEGEVFAGGKASLEGEFTVTADSVAIEGKVSAFFGVEATASVDQKVSIGGYDVGDAKVTGGVTAGLGAEAKGGVNFKDGKVRIGGGFKVAVGVGFELNADISFDLNEISRGVNDFVQDPVGSITNLFHW